MSVLSRAAVETAVTEAAMAPSVLNTQPWRFVLRDDSIELHRDGGRALPVSDPQRRALTVSCGAALFNLRLAIAALGCEAHVDLLPDAESPDLLARVRIGAPATPSLMESRLHAAISSRRTSRVPYVDQPLAPEVVLALESAAEAESAALRVLDAYDMNDIGKLIREADQSQRYDHELRDELLAWTRRDGTAVDGIPDSALGPSPHDLSSLVRDFAMGLPVEGRERMSFERDPGLAVLLTDGDDTADWLVAGQALERVWLEATAAGLAVSLLMQPIELTSMRWLARPPISAGERTSAGTRNPYWPQALLRIGVATQATAPTPRRPLADILEFAPHKSAVYA